MDLRHPLQQRAISKGLGVTLLICFLVPSLTSAYPLPDKIALENPNYYFEFLTFKSVDPTKAFLEILCQVPVANLKQIEKAYGMEAAYDLSITLFNRETWHTNVLSHSDSVLIEQDAMSSPAKPQIVRFTFLAEPGDYLATVKLADTHQDTYFGFDHVVGVPDYHFGELQVSSLQIASSITKAQKPSNLVKNERLIVPNISHVFGPGLETIHVYAEVYHLAVDNTTQNHFEATFSIFDPAGNRITTAPYKIAKPGASGAISMSVPVNELPSGNYELVLEVTDLDNSQTASRSANIIILRPETAHSPNSLAETIRKLGDPVRHDETTRPNTLVSHDRTSGTQRWQKGEPNLSNLASDSDHSARRAYANEHFFNSNGEGWETDQGRVYLKNGPPSYVNRISRAGEIYEIWEYRGLDRQYLFIDEWGKGQFRLLETLSPLSKKSKSSSPKK